MFDSTRLDRIETLVQRLAAELPPADSPHRDNLQCWKRRPQVACRCVAWQDLIQEGSASEPSRRVTGCYFELFPWLISGAIAKSSETIADLGALRGDVQRVEREVAGGLNRVGAAVIGGLEAIGARVTEALAVAGREEPRQIAAEAQVEEEAS